MSKATSIYEELTSSISPNMNNALTYKIAVLEALLYVGEITATEFFDLRGELYRPQNLSSGTSTTKNIDGYTSLSKRL